VAVIPLKAMIFRLGWSWANARFRTISFWCCHFVTALVRAAAYNQQRCGVEGLGVLLVLGVIWTVLAVIVGVEANSRGYSGFGWASLALLASPFLTGCVLMALTRIRPENGGDHQSTQRNVKGSRQVSLSAKIGRGAALSDIKEGLDEIIRRAAIKLRWAVGPRKKPNFPRWTGEIFSQMQPLAEQDFSAPSSEERSEHAASVDEADLASNHGGHLKLALLRAIGDLMGAAETVDRLKGELSDHGGGRPLIRDRLEPIVEGRPLRGRRIRLTMFLEYENVVADGAADGTQSPKIIAGPGSVNGRSALVGAGRYESRCA
jgi:hypothetical protein